MEKCDRINLIMFITIILFVTALSCTVMITTGSSEMTVSDSPSVVSDIKDDIHLDIGGGEVKVKDSVEVDLIN